VQWVLLENVPNMLRLHGGAALRHIIDELERLGYAWAYRVIDTRAFGVPQRRLRVFILASLVADPAPILLRPSAEPRTNEKIHGTRGGSGKNDSCGASAYGFYWTEGNKGVGWTENALPTLKGGSTLGIPSPPAVWFPRRPLEHAFVIPSIEDGEALQGFERGWTDVCDENLARRARWKMVGNAVSVPVAAWIGRRLASKVGAWKAGDRLEPNAVLPRAAHGYKTGKRYQSDTSIWPVHVKRIPLARLLRDPSPLTFGAASGFYRRLERSGLRIAPIEFRRALSGYIERAEARCI
jgi:DNA (cytosine-5)-methyltransferase 1